MDYCSSYPEQCDNFEEVLSCHGFLDDCIDDECKSECEKQALRGLISDDQIQECTTLSAERIRSAENVEAKFCMPPYYYNSGYYDYWGNCID